MITPGLSDALRRLAIRGGHVIRSFFTTDQVTYLYTQRPIIIKRIEEFAKRGDIINRSLLLYTQPIRLAQRRAEAEYQRSFRANYPAILGGLLDAAEGGLTDGFGGHAPVPCYRIARRARQDVLIERFVCETRVDLENVNAEPLPFHAKYLGEPETVNLLAEYSILPGKPRRVTIEPIFTSAG